ncbi:MAG TPA: permease-like cell division protein FtsX [Bacillota bacterium]|jgi:cell division transport system permease protein|nr:permease-like cell division protein FtsX [Peptococcaceae bacterium MAG4]NLW37515.1 ABC transporter permease [Peptococcaceae bacterium]HPZ43618.1 permease-like cell division protein FtsX [Bacillota bacterium]HQD76128.1 permease-like cell division protein FtsX [Bacillota bacterium]HUM58831.1 permease-like cell division protein FtsX [Bacillota bacterium]
MRLSTIAYYFREAFYSVLRNSWLSVASIGVVAVSLLILGSSLLVVMNANKIAENLESSVEISVFLQDETTPEDIKELEAALRSLPEVAELKFVSKQEALKEMQENFGEQGDILEGLEEKNPLPDTFRIKTQTVEQVVPLARELAAYPRVDQVRYGQGVVEKLLDLSRWVRTAGLVTMVLLAIAAVFLIATTIRLSVFARRKEIGIMKFLGATNWFVRFPFLLEGMFLGLAGALLAVVAVYYGYQSLVKNIQVSLPFMQLVTDHSLLVPMLEGLLVLGLALGALGSLISLRKFLNA